jgi:hypothetical protein
LTTDSPSLRHVFKAVITVAELILQFGLDPHMFGYQGHPNLQGAGLIDFVPLARPIDMTKVRESDAAAEKEAKDAAEAAKKVVE